MRYPIFSTSFPEVAVGGMSMQLSPQTLGNMKKKSSMLLDCELNGDLVALADHSWSEQLVWIFFRLKFESGRIFFIVCLIKRHYYHHGLPGLTLFSVILGRLNARSIHWQCALVSPPILWKWSNHYILFAVLIWAKLKTDILPSFHKHCKAFTLWMMRGSMSNLFLLYQILSGK